MAYVKRNSTNSLKNSIDYILDNSKTDDLLVYENQLATINTDEIVEQMNRTKEYFTMFFLFQIERSDTKFNFN